MQLSKFEIIGLYGYYNLAINIVENKLILVAKNGASKTTILKLIFYFLTKQWENLSTFNFKIIKATINGKEYSFSREDYLTPRSQQNVLENLALSYPLYNDFINNELPLWNLESIVERSHSVEFIAEKYDIPAGLLAKFLDTLLLSRRPPTIYDWKQYVIYLPTYRRIEEDFSNIFSDFNTILNSYLKTSYPASNKKSSEENLEEDFLSHDKVFHHLWEGRDREKWLNKMDVQYLELVEFGMDDILYKIKEISKIQNQSTLTKNYDSFIKVCNKYLNPEKNLEVKNNLLNIIIKDKEVELADISKLSSGEKQIVALFFHLYLDEVKPLVIIDEPEISLSLRWQQEILKDILLSNVDGLIVATHSPFIIDSELKPFAHSINEFLV